jgi:hypothetical protein
MRNICIAALLAITSACSAQQADATRPFSAPCSEVSPASLIYFRHNGLVLNPDSTCKDCFIGETAHLTDTHGHSISAHSALKHYMDTSHDGKDVFGAWYVHTQLKTIAKLRFEPAAQDTCIAHLLFVYSWYATEFLVAVPFDGDYASRPSNLRLEKEYLAAIAQNISSAASH